jgi:hypothetical protein
MRQSVVVLASMAATLLLASGVALAVTKVGSAGDNVLYGTNNPVVRWRDAHRCWTGAVLTSENTSKRKLGFRAAR